jgi:signal transduction histidine kinase
MGFAEWERDFVLGRLRILLWLAVAILGTYLVSDLVTFGWQSRQVAYRLLAEVMVVGMLLLRGTALVRRNTTPAMVLAGFAIGFITLASVERSADSSEYDAAVLVFAASRFVMIMIFVANAVTIPTRWYAHLAIQVAAIGFFSFRWPDVFATLHEAGQLVWMLMGLLWVCVICDLSVFLYSRLQRSEFEARSELEEISRSRKTYLDGLVRIGISATASDPSSQARAVLDELIGLLGAERAYLYLADSSGQLAFHAGRSAAGADVPAPPQGTASDAGLLLVPLRMREQAVGEILLERAAGEEPPGAVADFVQALASHAAIALETVRSTEELRVARDRALDAGRAKDAFLHTMSHELRTPLNAMIGYSEMLVEDLEDGGDAEHAADARRVHGAANHLLGIIADILELTKIEADRSAVVAARFPVEEAVRAVEAAIAPEAERNQNSLEVTIAPDVGSMTSDRGRVELILKKLLGNACKFTQQGKVGCEVTREQREGADWVRFGVTDTGIGMTEEQLARCFEPFYQADLSTTREYGGAGLGLTTAVRLCEALGGSITARSAPGEGSSFTVSLPG